MPLKLTKSILGAVCLATCLAAAMLTPAAAQTADRISGPVKLLTDLIGGQVAIGIDQFPLVFYKTGKICLLATSGASRSALTPDVPTFKEQGYAGVEAEGWFGACMQAKTPAAIVQRVSDALVEAVRQPDVRQKLELAGVEATDLRAPEFAALVAADRARWKPVIEVSGFRAD